MVRLNNILPILKGGFSFVEIKIGYVPPHKEVTSQTPACCVMAIFQKTQNNLASFTSYLVWLVVKLSSFQKGLSLNKTSKTAVWSGAKIF